MFTPYANLDGAQQLCYRLLFDSLRAIVSFGVRFFREIPVNLISFASLTYGQSS